jgi:hypothetical protein
VLAPAGDMSPGRVGICSLEWFVWGSKGFMGRRILGSAPGVPAEPQDFGGFVDIAGKIFLWWRSLDARTGGSSVSARGRNGSRRGGLSGTSVKGKNSRVKFS